MASHMLLSSHMVMFTGIPCMEHTVSQCFQCLHSYLPSIPTLMLRASSLLYPCAVVFVSTIKKKLLFFPPSWQCHQSLPIDSLLASSISYCVLINLFCVASPVLYMISAFACDRLLMLPPVYPLWMCIMAYLLMH